MTNGDICPECSREIPENAPAGICPHCLLQAGMESPAHEPTHLQQFQPPAVATLSPLFDQLEIESLLGQGGMGAVYRARQLKLDRLVALKLLRPESSANDSFAERFNREARTLARLSHPQIVGVHDFGELEAAAENESPQTLYYFLMEYVAGNNLRELMETGPLPAAQAISIVAQVCEALQYAHEEGVIHRDIKPENILIDARGRVKIADFGLAKLATPSEHDFTLTGTHQVMGTPRYMAPEQMAGSRAVDHRADLYSLGVVFYEMLTGEIPAGHFSPPSQHAAIDVRLDDVVMKALAQNPGDRFQSAGEIRSSLETIAQDETESVVSEPEQVPARGISTIFEREVAAAWHWMVDKTPLAETPAPGKTATQFPSLLMGLLCIIGLLLPLAPWMTIAVTDPDVVHGIPSEELTMFRGSSSKVIEKSGFEHQAGIVSAILLTMLAVLCLSVPSWCRPNRIVALAMVAMSAGALLSVFFFPNQTEHIYLQFKHFYDAGSGETEYTWNQNPISQLDHKVYLQPGFYGSLTISGILLLLSAIGLRHAEPLKKSARTWQEVWTAELAANLMLAATIVLSLLGGLTILLPWAEIHVDQRVDVSQIARGAKLAGPVVQERFGTDIWSSAAAPITCLVLVLVIALAPSRKSPGIILSGVLVLLSVVALIHTLAFTQEIKHQPAITLPLSMSPLEAEFLRNSDESGDQQYDPEAEAAAPREIVNQKVSPRAIEHSLIYREGFYSALGISLTLVVLNIVSVRNAILNREPKTKTAESWSGTPLESLQFSVPSQGDIGAKVKFHFLGQGYELAEERPGVWIFQRGRTMSAIFESDIRLYPTRLTVNSIDTDQGELLVNCHWSVRLMGGWARKKDIKILEDEGRKLQALLGGQIDEPSDAVAASLAAGSENIAQSTAETIDEDASERWIKPGSAEIDLNAVEEEVNLPAIGMIVVGLVMAIAHFIVIVTSLEDSQTVGMWLAVPGIFVGIALLVGGIGLHGLRSHSCAQVGIVAGFIPVSPVFIFTMIISVFAMNALSKPQVRLAFRERKNRRWDEVTRRAIDSSQDEHLDIVAVEEEISSPALAMIVFGLLSLLAHIGLMIFSLISRSMADNVWAFIPGILPALLMIIGGLSMRKLGSLSWSRIGIIGGLLPLSPAWIIHAVISTWAHQTLQKPHVKRAFLERARRRRELSSLEAVESPSSDSAEPSAEIDLIAVEDEVSGPAIAMIVVGLLNLLGHIGLILFYMSHRSIANNAWGWMPGLLPALLMIVGGLSMIVGGLSMRKLGSLSWSRIGIIGGLLPLSPAWLLTLPVSIWTIIVFRRPHVKRAFLERARRRRELISLEAVSPESSATDSIDLIAVEDEVSMPAIAMIAVGLLTLIGLASADFMILSNRSDPLLVWLSIPGLLVGLGMLVGGFNLKGLRSRGWAQLGAIAAMLPFHMAWLLTFPIGIWVQVVLNRLHVKRAFLERARQRRELISQMNMEATELDMEALHQEVSGPSMSLIIFGVICFLGHTVHFGFMLNSFENELAVFLLPGMLTGIMMVLSGLNIRSFKSRGTTQLGLILGMLPLNLGWPLTLPVSGWASIVFHDPSIKQAYLQRQHQRESAILRQKSLMGIFLFVLILLMLAGVLIGGFMLSSRQLSRHDDYVTVPHKPPEAVLHNAAAQGDIKQVKQSLDEGADVNDKDDHGQTPLMNAAKGGDPRMVAYLMLRGADEQARDPEGKTALMYAVELGHADVVRMLIDLEQAHYDEEIQFRLSRIAPDVADTIDFSKLRFDVGRNMVDGQGESPLMKAASMGESDILGSLLLFSDDTLQDRRGRTALMHAIERLREDLLAPHFDKADAWIDALKPGNEYTGFIRPQTLAIADSDGWTPLKRAEQIGLKKTAARIEGYLKSVIDRSTRLIEEDAQNSQAHYHHRALAYKALGETEKAEADFKASREPE